MYCIIIIVVISISSSVILHILVTLIIDRVAILSLFAKFKVDADPGRGHMKSPKIN